MKRNILFLCTGNSCRSQMAEAWGCHLKSDKYNFYSAGTKKHGLNSFAVEVMKEVGIDISQQISKTTEELPAVKMDYVITVCADAHENCPYFPGGKIIHRGFDDPPRLANQMESHEEVLTLYRRVRDEIKSMVSNIEKVLV
ncbi:MAG: arsenate reductase ArsC [Halobacteriovoraceae bacterium]|nr:arsenate reductase ArsC [Halobacteriovoraceae bacterium]MCB9095337.1 arsenate reductase ArsC [Halobacteriovoraceae bacterium]